MFASQPPTPNPHLSQDGIEVVKLATRALVYFHVPSKSPMFFDADGRGNLFPTVYAMWLVRQQLEARLAAPEAAAPGGAGGEAGQGGGGGGRYCCPPLVVHPPVSKFLLNGADVMLPGTKTSVDAAKNGFTKCKKFKKFKKTKTRGLTQSE